ncbi:hypothetical protein [Streptomyces sp. NPDC006551]|uniref:hypothetical protein n=1 Tax=Streptomyces sp. NPDC006551 TaxID=3157178 RepID=UPI0033A6AC25
MTDPDVRQVLVHPAVWPHLELWLATRGLVLGRVPVEDDLPTYAMVLAAPGDAEKVLPAGVRDAARQAAEQPAAEPLRVCSCGDAAPHTFCTPAAGEQDAGQPAEAEFTEARAAFIQIGQTPALQGLRVELHIEGYPPLVGNYAGAGMRRIDDGVMAIEPTLLFAYEDTSQADEAATP